MGLEQKINYQLNKYPRVKKVIKRAYQRTMYVVSPKIKSEGNIVRVSPDDPNHEYFFGYYDKSPWDATDRYMLCLKAKDTWSDVSPKDTADILLIDTDKAADDSSRYKKIAETRSWNVQQSCMLQWLGPDFSSRIIYNDFRDGKFVSVILSIEDGVERVIDAPVYTVSTDGKTALSLDFSRLYNLRPGYGYYNVPEITKGVALPDTIAVWKINLETGEVQDLLKYTDFAYFQPRHEMEEEGSVHKVNHLMISPNGKRFMVLYRWFNGQRKYTRLITCNVDGTDMYVLSDDDMVSHCCWMNNSSILAFENKKESGSGYYLMKDKTQQYVQYWKGIDFDGHPSFSPDGSRIVFDRYPDKARVAAVFVSDAKDRKRHDVQTVAKVFAPFKYDNDTRCDLHPRWNREGNQICFDSVFEGHRGLYVVPVEGLKHLNEKAINRNRGAISNHKISVIIPVYNVERYLERCVSSITNQSYSNLEIILIDDGSTDLSSKICDELAKKDNRIIVIHKKNEGLSSARNAGLDYCTGEFVSFVDSDDWIESDTYEYSLNLLISTNSDVVDFDCKYSYNSPDTIIQPEESINTYDGEDVLWSYLYRGLTIQHNAPYTVWRKLYKWKEISHIRFIENKNSEDLLYNYEVSKAIRRITYTNQIKYHYFQNSSGISMSSLKNKDLALIEISEKIYMLEQDNTYKNINKLAEIKLGRSYFSILARMAKEGCSSEIVKQDELEKRYVRELRKYYMLLMKSPIPASRKAFVTLTCVNYNALKEMFSIYNRIRKSS